MVARDDDGIGCPQFSDVGLAIASAVQRSRQRAVKQAIVANADRAAVFGELFVMDRKDELAS